jgi:hypothetical protein
MVVNKDGDLELYAMHDTPSHVQWNTRGDLTIGAGLHYGILQGRAEGETMPASQDQKNSGLLSQALRFPGLNADGSLRHPKLTHLNDNDSHFPHNIWNDAEAGLPRSMDSITLNGRGKGEALRHPDRSALPILAGHNSSEVPRRMMHQVLEEDISVLMRRRALLGLGLAHVSLKRIPW